jgi:hypothetical protein
MTNSLLIGLSVLFFTLGHSCLHHFQLAEKTGKSLSLGNALFPWPSRGRLVAVLAFFVSAICIALLATSTHDLDDAVWTSRSAGLLLLLSSPFIGHLTWLLSCIRQSPSGLTFRPAKPSERTVKLVLFIPVAFAALVYLIGFRPN